MSSFIIESVKGFIIICLVGLFLYLTGTGVYLLYLVLGEKIGYIGLVPTIFVLSYLIGQSFDFSKKHRKAR